jgi:hypothetical protein
VKKIDQIVARPFFVTIYASPKQWKKWAQNDGYPVIFNKNFSKENMNQWAKIRPIRSPWAQLPTYARLRQSFYCEHQS